MLEFENGVKMGSSWFEPVILKLRENTMLIKDTEWFKSSFPNYESPTKEQILEFKTETDRERQEHEEKYPEVLTDQSKLEFGYYWAEPVGTLRGEPQVMQYTEHGWYEIGNWESYDKVRLLSLDRIVFQSSSR